MIDKPLVTIGMPAYNGERYIRKALDSLLTQDYENFELIISDNASNDATLQICREYAARDERISVHVQSRNIGTLANFKTVLEMARGEYFMWAAVDDLWLPGFITQLVYQLENHQDAGVAMCSVKRVREDSSYFDEIRFSGKNNPNRKTFLGMALGLISSLKYNLYIYGLFRKGLLQSTDLMQEISAADRWLMFQISLASKFRYVDSILHVRTVREKSFAERYPDDKYIKNINKKWFNFRLVLVVNRIICRSKIIPWHRRLFAPIILSYLIYTILLLGLKNIPLRLWAKLKPHCSKAFLEFFWKMKIIKTKP